jgi:hypothetical protein
MERRTISSGFAGLEVRKEGDKPTRIAGYGAVYWREGVPGTEYRLWQDAYERIMPGAFDEAIKRDDIRSLFNHNADIVLGRASAGTLTLTTDDTGLRYDVTPPDTQLIRDQVLTPIQRGDVSGSSFMFRATKVDWGEEDRDGRTVEIRNIRGVELYEVGPVVFPAYEASSAGVRVAKSDMDLVRGEHAEWRNALAADLARIERENRKSAEAAASVRVALAKLMI